MDQREHSEQELKLTAAIYATQERVVEIIRQTGKLPEVIPNGGFLIAMNVIIHQRGRISPLTQMKSLSTRLFCVKDACQEAA